MNASYHHLPSNIARRFLILLPVIFISLNISGQTQTFTSSGTFTVPPGVTSIVVECWGGGGGGGSSYTSPTNRRAGGGGGGGGYSLSIVAVTPGNSYNIVVGNGGSGGVVGNGSAGGASTFNVVTVVANGGAGGLRGGNGAGGAGALVGTGDITYRGGNGGTGSNPAGSGGGGGGAGSTGTGGNALSTTAGTGTTLNGGNGGAGRTTFSANGNNGSTYGGGGSGGYSLANAGDRSGGAGAKGLVIITIPPRFISQPSDFSGCTASFSVVATGNAPLTYQWQENNGGGFSNITDGGIYGGTTASTLTISGASDAMNGYMYRCVVTDASGYSSTSTGATLTVIPPVLKFGFGYSMDITLSPASGSSDLTDFPALISFTSTLLRTTAFGGHTNNSNGYDIIFTDQNGSKLDHQLEYYNASTGNYVAWVRIPVLSQSSSTTIRMYYGNPLVSVNPSVKSVWTSSYKGVWHMNGSDYTDATTYLNNGTSVNTTSITGKIAGGRGFNGSTSYIQVTTTGFVPNDNNQTISIWANYPVAPTDNRNLISFQAGQTGSAIQLGFRGGHAVAWEWGGTILADGGAAPSINNWHYYVYTFDGTTSWIYIDGVLKGSSTVAPQTLLPTEGNFGRYNPGEYINANLDEPRFSMSPKSSGWILTEYNNQNNPAGFITLGSEVNATLLSSVGVCSTTYTLDQGFPAGGIYSGDGVSGSNFNASVAGVGTHAITYLYTGANGCSSSAVKNIVVTPIPAAPAVTNKQCCISNIVDIDGTGTNLKWYSDAGLTNLVGTGTPFATGKTTAGIYTYYVTQTINGCTSPASSASLTILNGTAITTHPQPSTICNGDNASFSVAATGYNMTYQWQENGFNIINGGIYSGANSATLTLTNPGMAKNGKLYRCLIYSSCGTSPAASSTALLTVTALPVATFSYTGTPYCPTAANPFPAFSGGGIAGTFSSTSGLVFVSPATGQVNLSASTPGTYTVTNTIAAAGGCGIVTATSPITIISDQIWTGTSGTDWNTPGNWSCGYLPNLTTNVQIPDVPNKPVIGGGATAKVKNLVIDPGSSLTVTGNTVQISGTITNNGTFTAVSGTIEMNGSVVQSVGSGTFAGNTIKDLIINNISGVTLLGPLNVSGKVLVQNGDLSSGGNLTLLSTATQTALIDGTGTGNVTGNVTIQRYLPSGFGYKYISSPVQSATVNEFSDDMTLGAFTFFWYDESRTASGWVSYNSPSTNPLIPMRGYSVNFGSSSLPKTVDITGVVNNGSMSVTLYNNNNTYTKGFNLVGNPYPSPIDWAASSGWTKTNIDNALYYFKASTTDQYGGTYGTYINGISSDEGSSSNIIPSMQGFLIHVSDVPAPYPVTGTLALNNNVRITDLTHPFSAKKSIKASIPFLRLIARFSDDTGSADPVVIYFDDKATPEFNSELDALKLLNTDLKIPNLYSVKSSGEKLSINALPPVPDNIVNVPLGMKINRAGNIIFRINDIDETLTGMRIYLSDIVAGTEQDLMNGKEYIVSLAQGEYTDRFFLNLSNLTTGTPDDIFKPEVFNIYSSDGLLKAEIFGLQGKSGTLNIINLLGQVVFTDMIYTVGYHEFDPGLKDGIYIVNFTSGTFRISKKLFIQHR